VEAASLLADATALERTERAATLLPIWRLRTFDELTSGTQEQGLLASTQALTYEASETLLPILELWHPDVLAATRNRSAFQADVATLANVRPETDPISLVDDVNHLLEQLQQAYERDPIAHFDDPLNQPIVAVSFKRPAGWGPACSHCLESTSGLPSASDSRARAVWNAIEAALRQREAVPSRSCQNDNDCRDLPGTRCGVEKASPACERASTRVSFGLEAADVYRHQGGQATLPCFLATPVVQQWGLLFANQSDDHDSDLRVLSQSGRRLEARANASQEFVTESGTLDYLMTDAASLSSGISLLYSSDETAFSTFQSFANDRLLQGRNPVGLSALSEISIDFAPIANMRHSFGNGIGETADRAVSELVFLLRLDAREFASDPPGRELETVLSDCHEPLFPPITLSSDALTPPPLVLSSFESGTDGWVRSPFEPPSVGRVLHSRTHASLGNFGLALDVSRAGWFAVTWPRPLDLSAYDAISLTLFPGPSGARYQLAVQTGTNRAGCADAEGFVPAGGSQTVSISLKTMPCGTPDPTRVHRLLLKVDTDAGIDDVRAVTLPAVPPPPPVAPPPPRPSPLVLYSFETGTEGWGRHFLTAPDAGNVSQSNAFASEGQFGLSVDVGTGGWFAAIPERPLDLSNYTSLAVDFRNGSSTSYYQLGLQTGSGFTWCGGETGQLAPNASRTATLSLLNLSCGVPVRSQVQSVFLYVNGDVLLDNIRAVP
jgi:hypothetical protein